MTKIPAANESYFIKITRPEEVRIIYQIMGGGDVDLECFDAQKKKMILRGHRISKGVLAADYYSGERLSSPVVTVTFQGDGVEYFIKAPMQVKGKGNYNLDLSQGFFKLQRRKHFRFPIPDDYGAFFDLASINGHPKTMHIKIVDISPGGFAFSEKPAVWTFRVGEHLEGYLHLAGHPITYIWAKVRNFRLDGDKNRFVGLEFDHLSGSSENVLSQAIMDLQMQMFSLLKQK